MKAGEVGISVIKEGFCILGTLNLSSRPEALKIDYAFELPEVFKKCLFMYLASIQI